MIKLIIVNEAAIRNPFLLTFFFFNLFFLDVISVTDDVFLSSKACSSENIIVKPALFNDVRLSCRIFIITLLSISLDFFKWS